MNEEFDNHSSDKISEDRTEKDSLLKEGVMTKYVNPFSLVILMLAIMIVFFNRARIYDVIYPLVPFKNILPQGDDSKNKENFFGWDIREDILEESGDMKKSKSATWWVNSGGMAYEQKGIVTTNEGNLDKDSYWRKLYEKTNSEDTDDGYHPQNIFRFVNRHKWQNISQQVYFYIDQINLSSSKQRDASNGVLLFNRYQDGDNLYYVGLRVDGFAVIKKKIDGEYFTLEDKQIFSPDKKYDRVNNSNFLPLKTWIGIKSEVRNIDSKTVEIKLYVFENNKKEWTLVLDTKDKGDEYGDKPIASSGYAGIRTDFMDVRFRDYGVSEIGQ